MADVADITTTSTESFTDGGTILKNDTFRVSPVTNGSVYVVDLVVRGFDDLVVKNTAGFTKEVTEKLTVELVEKETGASISTLASYRQSQRINGTGVISLAATSFTIGRFISSYHELSVTREVFNGNGDIVSNESQTAGDKIKTLGRRVL